MTFSTPFCRLHKTQNGGEMKEQVQCKTCGNQLLRTTWNYARNRKIIDFFCDNKCKWDYQRTLKPVTKEWLYEAYVNQKMDTSTIGSIVNRDPKSVWNWLKDFGIPTRGRGHGVPVEELSSRFPSWKGKTHTEESKKKMSDTAKLEGRVPYNPEVGSYMKGRCGKDHPQWKGGCTPERQAFYSSPEWVDAVKQVWCRDNAYCRRCGIHHNQTKIRGSFHIHHIVSFMVKEKRADVDNLVLLCAKCHRWVHGKKNTIKLFLGGSE